MTAQRTSLLARIVALLALCVAWPAHAGSRAAISTMQGLEGSAGNGWEQAAGIGALVAQGGVNSPLPILLVMFLSFVCLRQLTH